jgi:hypothetical protein
VQEGGGGGEGEKGGGGARQAARPDQAGPSPQSKDYTGERARGRRVVPGTLVINCGISITLLQHVYIM